jgi:dipeptidyl aminopeptidase/acylaminoacyl peptidase
VLIDGGLQRSIMPRPPSVDRGRLESLLSIPLLLGARVSTRRDRVGFITNPTGRFELYVLSLSDRNPRQLTHGELSRSPISGFVWSADGGAIVFGRDLGGDELHDLFRIGVESSEVEQLTHDRTCQRYAWESSPDDRWLLIASDKGMAGEGRQVDFWRLPLTGGDAQRLTHHVQPVYPWYSRNVIRPDGKKIAYASSDSNNPSDESVFVTGSDGSGTELLYSTKPGSKDRPGGWSPDGNSLAISSDAFDRIRTGILDIGTREVRWIGSGAYDEIPIEFSPDGRRLLVLRTTGVGVYAVVHDLVSGGITVSPFHTSYTGETAFTADGKAVVATSNSSGRPTEICLWDLESGTVRSLWKPPLGKVSIESLMAGKIVRYPTFDGREIEALLLQPRESGTGERLPAIVYVHGGPNWQWFDEFEPVIQFMVSQGYVVLLPNIRGSIGYGAAFRDLILKDPGGGDLKDTAAAAEYLKSLPNVDPGRLGITGISYGGFMTYIAMTKRPELWAAGCAEAGITDWEKGYEVELPALQQLDRMLLGDPKENAELWADRSPVNFADKLQAPLMMIHGLNDPRCPVIHAHLFRDALLKLGRKEGEDFEYLEFSDEGHSSFDVEQRMRSIIPMMEFFQRRLLAHSNPILSKPPP